MRNDNLPSKKEKKSASDHWSLLKILLIFLYFTRKTFEIWFWYNRSFGQWQKTGLAITDSILNTVIPGGASVQPRSQALNLFNSPL